MPSTDDRGRRVDRGQRLRRGLLRGEPLQRLLLRRPGRVAPAAGLAGSVKCSAVWSLLDQSHRSRAVADQVGLGQVADQGQPGLLRAAVPDPHGVRAGQQGRAALVELPWSGQRRAGRAGPSRRRCRRTAGPGPTATSASRLAGGLGRQVGEASADIERHADRSGDGDARRRRGRPSGRGRPRRVAGVLMGSPCNTVACEDPEESLSRVLSDRPTAGDGAGWALCGCWWSRTRCGWPRRCSEGCGPRASASTSPTTARTGCTWPARAAYDAVVLDVMLPKLNGYRVCQTLRAEQNWVPVLMLSAKDGEYDEADGLDVGRRRLPDQAVLLRRAAGPAARAAAPGRARAAGRAGGRRPRRSTRRPGGSTRGDDEIALTPREFAVLELLMRRRGEVVPKAEILAHVWDDERGRRPQRGRGLRRLPAPQDRRAVRPGRPADRARRGLPARRGRRLRGSRAMAACAEPAGSACAPGSPCSPPAWSRSPWPLGAGAAAARRPALGPALARRLGPAAGQGRRGAGPHRAAARPGARRRRARPGCRSSTPRAG